MNAPREVRSGSEIGLSMVRFLKALILVNLEDRVKMNYNMGLRIKRDLRTLLELGFIVL